MITRTTNEQLEGIVYTPFNMLRGICTMHDINVQGVVVRVIGAFPSKDYPNTWDLYFVLMDPQSLIEKEVLLYLEDPDGMYIVQQGHWLTFTDVKYEGTSETEGRIICGPELDLEYISNSSRRNSPQP
ncbi:hypothetical protein BX616_005007 [Lobosporangium transversale]|uniref:Uncharacterized protein n=1 Tax=Lobosporangium transversale TaxID=64571 RepID=A0A1Y2GMQ0_9FUNG|nr:hypothetical protein BCR41DRAFT_371305 [Lobosporangium transversale]KAF9897772.1 hypothetical protein BX616_005007 [Lobosporangium transversale]ORZ13780.1 hypothetical protein BCR41DRAFT_371305 [Lobosporangium transversale]|eukprot:XP_021880564.1 hypothetical protein BCR41DRAFT_371305 [Lobosporangium transversale]